MMALALTLSIFGAVPAPARPVAPPDQRYPFAVGETLTYDAKLGMVTLGRATLQVAGLDTVRGAETFLFRFRLTARTPFYSLDDALESWTTTADFASLRYRQNYGEESDEADRTFDIYPSRALYRQIGRDTAYRSVENPLDDTSFFYFLRITPLEVGETYVYDRYFKKDKNPIRVKVEKTERMKLPDGSEVDCLVLQPVVDTKGLFSKRSESRIWLTNDERRLPVQIRSKLKFGTVTLRLQEMAL